MKTALVLVLMLVVSTYYAEALWCYCWMSNTPGSSSWEYSGGATHNCCFEGDVHGEITGNYCDVGPESRGWIQKFKDCCARLGEKSHCK